jgi:flagellar motor switch protein FliN/FliY
VEDNDSERQSNNSNAGAPLTSFDKDTIGEILNISMGTAATTISTLLNRKVIITTPVVSTIKSEDFEIQSLQPAIGIQIEYIEGLTGSNIMVMKLSDIKAMVNILLSGDVLEDNDNDDELDEMHISAISEIMNQMMGASCTALASFFGKSINISPPKTFGVDELQSIINRLHSDEFVVLVTFCLYVDELISSEFITVLPMQFAKELVNIALNIQEPKKIIDVIDTQKKIAKKPTTPINDEISVENKKESSNNSPNYRRTEMQTNVMPNNRSSQVTVQPLKLNNFDDDDYFATHIDSNQSNFNLLLGIPLEVTVEIGRKRQTIKEILEIRQGSIIELDKQACDPVDIMVNGQLIAKGDVVVIEDNFGVRITEIISNNEIINKFNK